jgi:hypothetical protein
MVADAIEDGIVRSRVQVVLEKQVALILYYYRCRGCIYDCIVIERVRSQIGSRYRWRAFAASGLLI